MVFVSVALSIVSVIPRLIHIIEQQTFDLYIEVGEGEWCDVGAEVAEPDRRGGGLPGILAVHRLLVGSRAHAI